MNKEKLIESIKILSSGTIGSFFHVSNYIEIDDLVLRLLDYVYANDWPENTTWQIVCAAYKHDIDKMKDYDFQSTCGDERKRLSAHAMLIFICNNHSITESKSWDGTEIPSQSQVIAHLLNGKTLYTYTSEYIARKIGIYTHPMVDTGEGLPQYTFDIEENQQMSLL